MHNEHALRSDIDVVADDLIAHVRDCNDDDCVLCTLDSSSDDDPTPLLGLARRYHEMMTSADPATRALAREQLTRLHRAERASENGDPPTVTPDTGVDLIGLLAATVGPLTHRSNGTAVGPCPRHSSRSGQCLVVWPGEGHWWCSSCRRGGDAARWLALTEGIEHDEARRRLRLPRQRA